MPRLILTVVAPILLLVAPSSAIDQSSAARTPRTGAERPAGDVLTPVLELQILLDRAGFSPGEIDGTAGANTARAIEAIRKARGLPAKQADVATDIDTIRRALGTGADPLTTYVITDQDASGRFLPSIPSDMMALAELPGLYYTSVLEMIAERVHASPKVLQQLNRSAAFTAGERIRVPDVARQNTTASASRIVVSRESSGLTAFDAQDRVIFFAPVTSGSEHDPLPIGEWAVTAVVRNPVFNYNPALFWDADPAHAKAKIPAGPNNPVGTVWIDITKPHYGIHGAPDPSRVGHTASHGCVRLTNWDAETVATLVKKGTAVIFER